MVAARLLSNYQDLESLEEISQAKKSIKFLVVIVINKENAVLE